MKNLLSNHGKNTQLNFQKLDACTINPILFARGIRFTTPVKKVKFFIAQERKKERSKGAKGKDRVKGVVGEKRYGQSGNWFWDLTRIGTYLWGAG